jgi:integrase/recombinase XerD
VVEEAQISGEVVPWQDQTRDAITRASTDQELLAEWLHGKSPRSQRAYAADIAAFFGFVRKPLRAIKLRDLQEFQESLGGLATASQARRISAVKSFLSFARRTGYLPFDAGAMVKAPKVKHALAERILEESAVNRMLHTEPNARNRALLWLLYYGGLRISEMCNLRVRDLQSAEVEGTATGQATVFGKGGKERVVLLKPAAWRELQPLSVGVAHDAPVFRSREGGGPLDPSQVHRIVKQAAARAGLSSEVSAHWLRHAHVSHALDHGAPAHLVQATVGHASLTTTSRYAHARPKTSSSTYLPG